MNPHTDIYIIICMVSMCSESEGSESHKSTHTVETEMAGEKKTACVTGGNGYIASLLIKQLLEKGFAVHATVRNPEKWAKEPPLKELQGLGDLKLFKADLEEEGSFDDAVSGCDYVFHVATPVNVMAEDPENVLIKPAIHGALNVLKSCMKAKTVKRVVVTSSASAVSVNQLEGTGLVMHEDSWSDTEFLTAKRPPSWGYLVSKTLAEKEAWKFAQENKIDLVTIAPTLVIGAALTQNAPPTIKMGLSLLSGDEFGVGLLKGMQELKGSVSIVHVEDVCRAHIFAAETDSASGRYICCAINTSLPKLAEFLSERYPQYKVPTNFGNLSATPKLSLSSDKLVKAGFEFKHTHLGEIYDEVIEYGKTLGLLPFP